MEIVLIVLLVLFLFGGLPTWHWHSAGYWPSGSAGVLLVVLVLYLLLRDRR